MKKVLLLSVCTIGILSLTPLQASDSIPVPMNNPTSLGAIPSAPMDKDSAPMDKDSAPMDKDSAPMDKISPSKKMEEKYTMMKGCAEDMEKPQQDPGMMKKCATMLRSTLSKMEKKLAKLCAKHGDCAMKPNTPNDPMMNNQTPSQEQPVR